MSAHRRRKFSLPVLSRLTLAWLGAFGVVVLIIGVFAYSMTSGNGSGRISLAINELELMARAEPRPPIMEGPPSSSTPGLRLAAPNLREDNAVDDETDEPLDDANEGADTQDYLLYPEEFDLAEEDEAGGDIVITIGGGQRQATPVTSASLARSTALKIAEPDPSLLRSTPFGKAPRIGPDGRRAMHVYAAANYDHDGAPQVALIVGGLGLNATLTERAIDDLPPEISLAFAPYAKDLKFWTKKARDAGHEVLIELPMEGYGGNPEALGPAGLLTTRSREENLQRLDWLMSRFEGYFAATNYLGAKFSIQEDALSPILKKLSDAGVAYVDDTGAARIAAGDERGVVATVNRIVPPAPDDSRRNAVRRELRALEQIAQRDGAALGKTYAYAATLDEVAAWAADLEMNGFSPAPASAVLQARAASR